MSCCWRAAESGSYREENVFDRLSYYGAADGPHHGEACSSPTTEGAPFLSQVSQWVRYRYGLDRLEGLFGDRPGMGDPG